MDLSVIKSYLVSLGFTVDQPQLNKFNDAIRRTAKVVEDFTVGTFGIASMFVKAGLTVGTVLTSIATGTVALMDKVAGSDLGFQVYARRMFMSADAAKALKLATDALGYSLEDIIWGPPELRERYSQLIKDQQTMQKGLGPDFEVQMRRVRDVRFEFTRLGVELQYFGMNLAKSLGKALFGDEAGILKRLQDFNEWFQQHSPEIADWLANKLAPILRDVAHIFDDLWGIARQVDIKKVFDELVWVADKMRSIVDFVAAHPYLQKLLFAGAGAAVGGMLGGLPGAGIGAIAGGLFGPHLFGDGGTVSKDSIMKAIADTAAAYGISSAVALAVGKRESGYNQSAVSSTGALGIMQLMPRTAAGLGVDPTDPSQNIQGGVAYLAQLYKNNGGDWRKALEAYNGGQKHVDDGTVSKDAQTYADEILKQTGMSMRPAGASGGNINVGGVTVHVTEPNASKEDIYKATVAAIDDRMRDQARRNMTQFAGFYA